MRRLGLRTVVYRAVGIGAIIAGAAGALIAATNKVDTAKIPQDLISVRMLVSALQLRTWYLTPMCTFFAGVFLFTRKHVGEPWVWGAINDYLNSYRSHVFSEELGEPLHHHRVTLFRYVRWWQYPCWLYWPLCERLVPVERSGHTTQKSDTVFRVPDDAEKAEGVAGQTWRTFKTLIVPRLPDVTAKPTDDNIREYAKATWVTEDWIRNRLKSNRPLARSYCGIPIRVKGKEWGVIIIDSRDPKAIERASSEFYDLMGRCFSKLLERV